MADNSMPMPDEGASEELSPEAEFPVKLDTLQVEGTQPGIGDEVEVTVKGEVTRIVNDLAYVKPKTINDEPIQKGAIKPNPAVDEEARLQRMSQQADMAGSSPMGSTDTSTY